MNLKGSIEILADGFSVRLEGAERRVRWSAVRRVDALKWDLFSYDEICLELLLEDQTVVTVTESYERYRDLVDRLPEALPGCSDDWFSSVAFPAFEENRTTIFSRS